MKSIETTARDMFIFGFEDFTFDEILVVLKEADIRYFNDDANVLIEDNEYDALKQYAHALNPTHTYFLGVGSAVRGGKVKLPHPMGSLTQAYQGDVQRWVEKHNLQSKLLVITEKLDGVSALIVYDEKGCLQIAYSRGDGIEGADITRHIKQLECVPVRIASRKATVIRAEVIISKENFAKVQPLVKTRSGQLYKNPRNMIAGVMNAESNNKVVYEYIDVVGYEIITPADLDKAKQLEILFEDNQFIIPSVYYVKGKDLTDDNLTDSLQKLRKQSRYEIDGVVIEVNEADLRKKINPTKDTLNPEYARKYKVADTSNLAIATVVDVEWNISKDGYLKPRVRIEPIELVGVTVQHATGFNAKFIKDNCIGPGAQIKITRSGDVIPFILEVVEPADEPAMPDVNAHWTETGVDLIVENAEHHDTVKFEQLNDFFMTLDAPHLREGNLQKLFDAGLERPEDILNLTQQDLAGVLGSSVMAKKIFQGLRGKLHNIPQYVLMGAYPAFGRGVGVRKMKKLYEAFSGDMTRCSDRTAIVTVEGFDEKTAAKIVAGLPKYKEFLTKVSNGIIQFAPYETPKQGGWTGQTVVMTGFRSKELEQAVVDQGGKIGSSVSSKTTLVVADDPTSASGKAQKARELGIRIIGIEQFKQELGA